MGIAVDDPLPAHPFARAPGKADKRSHQRYNDKHQREGMLGHGGSGSHVAIVLALGFRRGKHVQQRHHGDMVASDPGHLERLLEPETGTGVFWCDR